MTPLTVEIIGTLSAVLVLASYFFTDQAKLRTFNIVASIGFIVYGFCLAAVSGWVNGWATIALNLSCIVTHVVWIVKHRKTSNTTPHSAADEISDEAKQDNH